MTEPAVNVENAETVNATTPAPTRLPYHGTLVAITIFILVAFVAVSFWVLAYSEDGTIRGSIIGTWTALATLAGQFWLGSSSGGKAKQ